MIPKNKNGGKPQVCLFPIIFLLQVETLAYAFFCKFSKDVRLFFAKVKHKLLPSKYIYDF